jgi:hypothetical protein
MILNRRKKAKVGGNLLVMISGRTILNLFSDNVLYRHHFSNPTKCSLANQFQTGKKS